MEQMCAQFYHVLMTLAFINYLPQPCPICNRSTVKGSGVININLPCALQLSGEKTFFVWWTAIIFNHVFLCKQKISQQISRPLEPRLYWRRPWTARGCLQFYDGSWSYQTGARRATERRAHIKQKQKHQQQKTFIKLLKTLRPSGQFCGHTSIAMKYRCTQWEREREGGEGGRE